MASPDILTGIAREMHHLAQRQRVIAQNIANSETPGFKARDVEAPNFSDLLALRGATQQPRVAKPRVAITSGMAALGAKAPHDGNIPFDRDVSETKPDGNNVTLEDQLLKMGQVQADFAAATSLYRRQQALLKSALGKTGS